MFPKQITISVRNLLFIVLLILLFGYWQNIQAQNENDAQNFRGLLEEIQLTAQNEPSIIIFFQFREPLSGSIQETLEIPTRENAGSIDRFISISRVGNDYICFYDTSGSARFEYCTPFSNIVSVSYLTN